MHLEADGYVETCIKELHEKWLPAHWRKDSHSL